MTDFISDDEMAKLDNNSSPDFISDEQMAAMSPPAPKEQPFAEKAADYAASAVPFVTSAAGGALGSLAGPLGSVAGGSAGYAAGNQVEKYLREKFMNQKQPETTPTEVVKDLGVGALGGLGGLAIKGVAKALPIAAERFATTPAINRVADAISPSTYMGGGGIGRAAGYVTPIVNKAQAAGDALKYGGQAAQKTVSWLLDNAPQKLGKFAPILQKASQTGGLATTEFLLSQTDPDFQALKKKLQDE